MSELLDIFLTLALLTGALFILLGSVALLKLPDFFMRLHGPTKATTLGTGAILIASAVFFSVHYEGISVHEVLITLFLFITTPVSAHLMAKSALHLKLKTIARNHPMQPAEEQVSKLPQRADTEPES